MTALIQDMFAKDPQCTYNIAAGDTSGFVPITHDYYDSIIAVRKAKSN